MRGARSGRAGMHVRNAFRACNLARSERAKTEQTLNVWLVIDRNPNCPGQTDRLRPLGRSLIFGGRTRNLKRSQ